MRSAEFIATELSEHADLLENTVGLDDEEFVAVAMAKVGNSMTEEEIRSSLILLRSDSQMVPVGNGRYLPLTPDMVIQPPDVLMEDGSSRKPMAVLHPRITSAIVMADYESGKLNSTKISVPAHLKRALDHVDPENIRLATEKILESHGIGTCYAHEATEIIITEFGRENKDGVFQSPNFNFNRTVSFAASLAARIKSLRPSTVNVSVVSVPGTKTSHYEATIRYIPEVLLTSSQTV